MANLKNLSERIKSVTSIQQVTKAMKMVAAAKVKKAQEKMEISRPYYWYNCNNK
jgi:F-type H+-transporting ATPase subunit gamma